MAYTNDTTLTVGSLISAGVMDRFPNLEFILSHGGGSLPFLIGRFDRMHRAADGNVTGNIAAQTPSDYLKRFYYDTIPHHGAGTKLPSRPRRSGPYAIGNGPSFPPGDPIH